MTATVQRTTSGMLDVTGFDYWPTRKAAQAVAVSKGWTKADVHLARRANWWKGWIVGQFVASDQFRGFAPDGSIVAAEVREIDWAAVVA